MKERGLGQHIQPGEETQSLVVGQGHDVVLAWLLQELERQGRAQRARGRDHGRGGIPRIEDGRVEADPIEERCEVKEQGGPALHLSGSEVELPRIGHRWGEGWDLSLLGRRALGEALDPSLSKDHPDRLVTGGESPLL